MAFMSLEIIFFFQKKKQALHDLAFFSFFVELLTSFMNERSHNTFQAKISKLIVSQNLMFLKNSL